MYRVGEKFYWNDSLYECLYCDSFSVVIKEEGSIESIHLSTVQLNTAYMQGAINTVEELAQQSEKAQKVILSDLPSYLQRVISCRLAYINLFNKFDLDKETLQEEMVSLTREYGLKEAPGISTVYRWRKAYSDSYENLLSLVDKRFRVTKRNI